MKKNTSIVSRTLRNLEEERFQRRLLQKAKRRQKNRKISGTNHLSSHTPKSRRQPWRHLDSWTDLPAPPDIDLSQHRDETCEFIKSVRSFVRNGVRLRMGFDQCKSIKLSALVLLLAQIHKLRLEFGMDHITGTYPENPRIERLLDQSGFYKLLHVKSRKSTANHSRLTRFIRFKTDQKPNSAEIPNLRDELLGEDLEMPAAIARKVFRALSEAMTNVNHHAYKTKTFENIHLGGRWWMVATLSERTKLFTLVFYDAGVGIPKTLPRKYPIEMIRGVLSLLPGVDPDDGQMIRAAMQLGRSSTNASNRGKGLMDLAKLIDAAGSGLMHIYSRHGAYTYSPAKESHSNHTGFVEGTLIEWQLPIDKALENLPQELLDELATHN